MPEAAEIDVVVPVHGGGDFVLQCLQALVEQDAPCRVIVVDDASPDDTPERIARAFPEVTLLRNEVNVGFAATCNRGMAAGTAPTVVLVNSDVVAAPTLVGAISAALAAAPRAGSVAVTLTRPDGLVDSIGITADATAAGFVRYHGARVDRERHDTPLLLGPYGAVAGYRRAALAEVGMLDEGIFMYGEELDLAFRLRAWGWDAALAPGVQGVHLGGASAGEGSPRQRYLAGFGRGYLLRAWRVLRGRRAVRAVLVELIVCARRLLLHRETASLRGRIAGWRAARGVHRPPFPVPACDPRIGLRTSLRMRSASFWEDR